VVLVDSQVWIDLLRGDLTPQVRALEELLLADEAALAPVIYQEILQGVTSQDGLRTLRDYFRTLPFLLPLHPIETYEATAELYVRCRNKGVTPRSPHDCVVARIAVEHGDSLLHDDRHFDALARIERKLKLY